MRYTIQKGVQQPFSEHFKELHFLLPLLLLLAGVSALAMLPSSPLHKNFNPLSIFSIHSPDEAINSGKKNNGKNNSSDKNKAKIAAKKAAEAAILAQQQAAAAASSGGNSGVSGGLGASAPAVSSAGSLLGGMGGGMGGGGSPISVSTSPQGGSITATVQTPGVSVGPVSVGPTTQTIDPPVPKPNVPTVPSPSLPSVPKPGLL